MTDWLEHHLAQVFQVRSDTLVDLNISDPAEFGLALIADMCDQSARMSLRIPFGPETFDLISRQPIAIDAILEEAKWFYANYTYEPTGQTINGCSSVMTLSNGRLGISVRAEPIDIYSPYVVMVKVRMD